MITRSEVIINTFDRLTDVTEGPNILTYKNGRVPGHFLVTDCSGSLYIKSDQVYVDKKKIHLRQVVLLPGSVAQLIILLEVPGYPDTFIFSWDLTKREYLFNEFNGLGPLEPKSAEIFDNLLNNSGSDRPSLFIFITNAIEGVLKKEGLLTDEANLEEYLEWLRLTEDDINGEALFLERFGRARGIDRKLLQQHHKNTPKQNKENFDRTPYETYFAALTKMNIQNIPSVKEFMTCLETGKLPPLPIKNRAQMLREVAKIVIGDDNIDDIQQLKVEFEMCETGVVDMKCEYRDIPGFLIR